jgi:hypothetical protein
MIRSSVFSVPGVCLGPDRSKSNGNTDDSQSFYARSTALVLSRKRLRREGVRAEDILSAERYSPSKGRASKMHK